MAIRVFGLDYKALVAYLCEGVTWTRLREIATKDPALGGLGLFRDTSQQCTDVFGQIPSAIIDTRPDTYLRFFKLLEGKERLLHKLAARDLAQRSLGVEIRAVVVHLGDIKNRILQKRVLQDILEKSMLLLYVLQPEASFSGNLHYMG